MKNLLTTLFGTFLRFNNCICKTIFPFINEAVRTAFLQPFGKTILPLARETKNCLYDSRQQERRYPFDIEKKELKTLQTEVSFSRRNNFWTANNLRASFAPCHTYSFLPFRSKSKTCQEQVSPWQSKMHFMLFSHGTCWGFRSPIPRITLRLSPRFLPAALTVLISQSKEKCLSAPKNKQTGQPKPTRIEAHSLEARMIDNTTSFAAFHL